MTNSLKRFLLFCSGTDLKIIHRKQCRQDYDKQMAMGVTIFLTAICASLSGGYAFYTVSHNYPSACVFGIFWGTIIWSMDRQLVLTTEKEARLQPKTFLSYATRAIVSILLAFVVATPFELWIFRDSINVKIDETQVVQSIAFEKSLPENMDIASLREQQTELSKLIAAQHNQLDEGREAYTKLLAQYKQTTFETKNLDNQNQEIQRVMFELEDNAEAIAQKIAASEQTKDQKVAEFKQTQARNRSFIAQLNALDALRREHLIVDLASRLIFYISTVLDVAPVMMKMLAPPSAYDAALLKEKRQALLELELEAERESEQTMSQSKMDSFIASQEVEDKLSEHVMDSVMSSEAKIAAMQSPTWQDSVKNVGQQYAKNTGDRLMRNRPKKNNSQRREEAAKQAQNDGYFTNAKPHNSDQNGSKTGSTNNVVEFYSQNHQPPNVNEHL